jgi:hypothetical protein
VAEKRRIRRDFVEFSGENAELKWGANANAAVG